jgi:hypothetical protein
MLKANGLVPIVAGQKRKATADPGEDELKREGSEVEDDDAEIKALEVNCFIFDNLFGRTFIPRYLRNG